jgi:hypothetical protein
MTVVDDDEPRLAHTSTILVAPLSVFWYHIEAASNRRNVLSEKTRTLTTNLPEPQWKRWRAPLNLDVSEEGARAQEYALQWHKKSDWLDSLRRETNIICDVVRPCHMHTSNKVRFHHPPPSSLETCPSSSSSSSSCRLPAHLPAHLPGRSWLAPWLS